MSDKLFGAYQSYLIQEVNPIYHSLGKKLTHYLLANFETHDTQSLRHSGYFSFIVGLTMYVHVQVVLYR